MTTPDHRPGFDTLDDARLAKNFLLRRVVELDPTLAWAGGPPVPPVDAVPVVSGLGIGITRGREHVFRLVVRYQYGKRPAPAIRSAVEEFDDGLIDYRAVVRPRLLTGPGSGSHRLEIGASVSHHLDTKAAGTAGFFGRDRDHADRRYLVSNAHVLMTRDGWAAGAEPPAGRPYTLSPAAGWGGRNPRDRVGVVHHAAPLDPERLNWIDAAVTALTEQASRQLGRKLNAFPADRPPGLRSDRITGYNDAPIELVQYPEPGVTPAPGLRVFKHGASTGWTSGVVSAVEVDTDVPVRAPDGILHYKNVIELTSPDEDFAGPGDSGSAVVDTQGRLLGILFAVNELYKPVGGSRVLAYAIPADAIRIYFPYLQLT